MKYYEEYTRIKVREAIQQGVRSQQIHNELGLRANSINFPPHLFGIIPLSLLVKIFGWLSFGMIRRVK
jgi:hypothetical protein